MWARNDSDSKIIINKTKKIMDKEKETWTCAVASAKILICAKFLCKSEFKLQFSLKVLPFVNVLTKLTKFCERQQHC